MNKQMLEKNMMKDCHGGVFVFVALALFLMATCMGVAVDMGRIMLVRSQAMAALDASVLFASSRAMPDTTLEEVSGTVQSYFEANFSDGKANAENWDIGYDADTGVITAKVDVSVNTFFGSFFAVDSVDVGLETQVQRVVGQTDFEIALVMDVTPSMCFDDAGTFSKAACSANKGKLLALRNSVNLLISTIDSATAQSASNAGSVYYSFAPFIHTVRVDDGNSATDDLNNNAWPNMSISLPISYLPYVRGLTTDGSKIISDLDSVMANMVNAGGTNTAIGTYWGWMSLREGNKDRFKGESAHENPSEHPAPMNSSNTFKIMILLTDGANSWYSFSKTANPKWREYHDGSADLHQQRYCEAMDQEGIEVFAIAFDVPPSADADKIKEIFRDDCAQEDKYPGHYFEASDQEQLQAAFSKIANYVMNLRIIK